MRARTLIPSTTLLGGPFKPRQARFDLSDPATTDRHAIALLAGEFDHAAVSIEPRAIHPGNVDDVATMHPGAEFRGFAAFVRPRRSRGSRNGTPFRRRRACNARRREWRLSRTRKVGREAIAFDWNVARGAARRPTRAAEWRKRADSLDHGFGGAVRRDWRRFGGDPFRPLVSLRDQQQEETARDHEGNNGDDDGQKVGRQRRRDRRGGTRIQQDLLVAV